MLDCAIRYYFGEKKREATPTMMQLCVVIPILVPQRAQYSVGDVTIPRNKEQKAITPYVRFLGVFQVCEKKRNAYYFYTP